MPASTLMPGPLSTQGRQKVLLIFWAAVIVLGAGVLFRTARLAGQVGRNTTYDRVRNILVRRLGVPPDRVAPHSRIEQLAPGGVDRLELFTAIEEELQVKLHEEEAAGIVTVQDAVNAVERARSPRVR